MYLCSKHFNLKDQNCGSALYSQLNHKFIIVREMPEAELRLIRSMQRLHFRLCDLSVECNQCYAVYVSLSIYCTVSVSDFHFLFQGMFGTVTAFLTGILMLFTFYRSFIVQDITGWTVVKVYIINSGFYILCQFAIIHWACKLRSSVRELIIWIECVNNAGLIRCSAFKPSL